MDDLNDFRDAHLLKERNFEYYFKKYEQYSKDQKLNDFSL